VEAHRAPRRDAAAAIDAAEGDGSTGTDAAVDAPPPIVHHGYVVSSQFVPTNEMQVSQFGLDLGSRTSSAADGQVDNALGRVLALLNVLNVPVQPANTAAVDQGALLLLLDLQAPDLSNAAAANLQIELGANPVPAACDGAADTVCRHHLDGTASFSIAPDSPTDAVLPGHIVAGAFTGGPGHFTLPLAIGSGLLVQLHLLHARVQASMISDAGIMTADIGGLVIRDEINTQIGSAIQQLVQAVIVRDCTPGAPPPGCGCSNTSTATLLALMDGDLGTPGDCLISTDEVLAFSFMKTDSCSMDTCTMPDALSIGVQVQAVKATFLGAI
jgi:hypothetical protein